MTLRLQSRDWAERDREKQRQKVEEGIAVCKIDKYFGSSRREWSRVSPLSEYLSKLAWLSRPLYVVYATLVGVAVRTARVVNMSRISRFVFDSSSFATVSFPSSLP